MSNKQQLRHEMFRRIANFGNTNREVFPESSPGGQAFATVAHAVTEIDQHTTTRLAGAVEARRGTDHTSATLRARLKAIARAVRELAVTNPELAKRLRLPKSRSDRALLEAAGLFIADTDAMKDDLVRLGLPPAFVTELRDLVTALHAVLDKRIKGQETRKAGATAVAEAFDRGFRAVHTLEVIVANTLRDDAIRLATWNAARHLPARNIGPVSDADVVTPAENIPPVDGPLVAPNATSESSEPVLAVQVPAAALRKVS